MSSDIADRETTEDYDHEQEFDCAMCRITWSLSSGFHNPKSTYAKLLRTAADGCELCELLCRVSETACTGANTIIQDDDVVSARKRDRGHARPALLEVSRKGTRGDSCPWPFLTSRHIPDENASIQDCAQSINRILNICNTNHITCKAGGLQQILGGSETPRFIPKRLLHVGSDSMSFHLRLHETTTDVASLEEVDLRYTALSHCWGSTPIIKTTTDTMSGFKTEGISWAGLPKTFQEAILLTRELGINYIWIDSLCILQDSVDDWAHEASQMARIFSNANLTIAASAAENGHQGLLNRRRTTRKLDAIHNDTVFPVYVRKEREHEFTDDGIGTFHSSDLPLRNRAWCMQEELLSVRIVYFTEDEVVFVCRTATICECSPHWQSRYQLPPIVGTDLMDPGEVWNNIVNHYTGRRISFCKDRLPALSSLTPFFENDLGRYHAGLWEYCLPDSLLWWTQRGKRSQPERNSRSRPPSWSWASVEGVIHYSRAYEYQDNIAEVIDVCTHPSTVDPRGMLSGGQITLRAPLLPLRGIWDECGNVWQEFLEYYSGERTFDSCFACSSGWASNFPWLQKDDCYCVLDDPTGPLMLLPNRVIDTPIFFLIIRTMDHSDPIEVFPYPEGYQFLGLLLKPLEHLDQIQAKAMENSESKLSFVRVGFGMMHLSEEDGEEALHRFGNTTVTIF